MNGPDGHKARKSPKKPQRIPSGSPEANRLAVLILEVLAGVRTPLDAAKARACGCRVTTNWRRVPSRACITALEPRPKVRQPSAEGRIARLEKALGEARRELLRQQALVRAAQRSLGLKPPAPDEAKPAGVKTPGHRKRRPAVRALKAARPLGPGYSHGGAGIGTTGGSGFAQPSGSLWTGWEWHAGRHVNHVGRSRG